jgi:alkylation response protein AidB-like acyl-CoA dehydrogenase
MEEQMAQADINSLIPQLFPLLDDGTAMSALRLELQRYVRNELGPSYLAHRAAHAIPEDVRAQSAEQFGGLLIPAKYGGLLTVTPDDGGVLTVPATMMIGEELAAARPGMAVTLIATNAFLGAGVAMFGTPEQKNRILPAIAAGKWIGGLALTERNTGSAAFASVETTYVRDGNGARLTGGKSWTTNGPIADEIVVVAQEKGGKAFSTFLVQRGAEGFIQGPAVKKWPIPDSATGELFLDETPAEFLGEPGAGKANTMAILTWGRIGVATKSNGGMRAAIEHATSYTMGRMSHGKPLSDNPLVASKLADMYVKLPLGQMMTRNAALALQANLPMLLSGSARMPEQVQIAASLGKFVSSTFVRQVVMEAIQLKASACVDEADPLFAYLTDGIIDGIFEGTQEIQALAVAKALTTAFKMFGWS